MGGKKDLTLAKDWSASSGSPITQPPQAWLLEIHFWIPDTVMLSMYATIAIVIIHCCSYDDTSFDKINPFAVF